jgi:O-antigen biosynthesis protein
MVEEMMTSKHGLRTDLENEHSSHALMAGLVGSGKRVLDVGCGAGELAGVLAQQGCKVTGVEADPEAARQAEERCERVVVGDVELLDLGAQLGEETFDVLAFGEVLEHLRDPAGTLKNLEPFLRPEGYVVASVANAAHGSVRLALVQGKFPYGRVAEGARLGAFTLEGLDRMFQEAGFVVAELRRASRGVFDTEVELDGESVPEEVVRLVQRDPESSTHRFVVSAHRSGEAGTLAQKVRLLSEQLEERDRLIFELNRKLRNFDELKRTLDERTEQLAEREREVTRLAQEVADRNDRLGKLVQFGSEDA